MPGSSGSRTSLGLHQPFCLPMAHFFGMYFGMAISPATCRAGRGLVDITQRDLADAARVGLSTVKAFKGGQSTPVTNNLLAIQTALEEAGVEFIAENGGGPGVRLRKAAL